MRSVLCSLAVLFVAGHLFAQEPSPTTADPPAVMGKTVIIVGTPAYTWNGNTATVTIEVTHEIDSDVHAWVGESRIAIHYFGLLEPQITVSSNGFQNGTPTPGGGKKKIVYTFTVEDGWEYKLTADMTYKLTANAANNTTRSDTPGKVKAKK